jgi:hypothetical protein
MTLKTDFRALAGQTTARLLVKVVLLTLIVAAAAFFSRGGIVLGLLIIFTGVTGPAIRLVTMKIDGTFDRIIVSPAVKPVFFLRFAGLWAIAVILPLIPAVILIAILQGPVIIMPFLLGTILAVTLGTFAGFEARGLSDAHLAALFMAGVLIPLSIIRTPASVFLPYTSLASALVDPAGLITSALLPAAGLVILAYATSRS